MEVEGALPLTEEDVALSLVEVDTEDTPVSLGLKKLGIFKVAPATKKKRR